MNTRLTRASLVVAAIGGLLAAGAAFADPLVPGKTRFGDLAPTAPAYKAQVQAKAAPADGRVSVLVYMQAGADRGPIRGFAITLAIGVLTSVFTAFTFSRLLVAQWVRIRRPSTIPI